jgi:hypothetical protein
LYIVKSNKENSDEINWDDEQKKKEHEEHEETSKPKEESSHWSYLFSNCFWTCSSSCSVKIENLQHI